MVQAILNTTEGWAHEIRNYYTHYRGATADGGVQAMYARQLASGVTTEAVLADMLASPAGWAKGGGQADNWITYVAKVSMNRAATSAERSSWKAMLAKTNGRELAAKAVVSSHDARQYRVNGYYQAYVHHSPTSDVMYNMLRNWVDDDNDRIRILVSTDYIGRNT